MGRGKAGERTKMMWPFRRSPEPKLVVDRIISLGALCEVAYQARRLSKSSRAYPFDWWDTPLAGLLRALKLGPQEVFNASHISKLPIDAGSLPAFYSGFAGTVHQHEFPRGENFLALDEAEISRRLLPKYAALHARLISDCASGTTLFVRQRKSINDPEGAALDVMISELEEALSAFASDFRLLLVDYDPICARPWLIQAHVQRHPDWTDLGSNSGWDEMFRSLGIVCRGTEDGFRFDDLTETFARPSSILAGLRQSWQRRQELRRRRSAG
uniref:Papain-like cysteine peptidase n=1 Tax=Bosea sp. NBC_00436 TaxID=2969620 RepID=A0A9E8CKT8_9HYPH